MVLELPFPEETKKEAEKLVEHCVLHKAYPYRTEIP